jgi:hypothetical protein
MAGHETRMEEMRSTFTFSCGNLKERDSLKGLTVKGTVKNIKLDHKETGYDDMIWIHLAQGRNHRPNLVNTGMNY